MDMHEFIANLRKVELWDSLRASSRYPKCADSGIGSLRSVIPCYRDYCEAYNSDASPFPEVAVTEAEVRACREFDDALDKSHWKTRSTEELGDGKVSSDNVLGKVGEFVAMRTMRSCGVKTDEPDLRIYDVHGKSFDADLHATFNSVRCGLSVKTFRIGNGLPSKVSWVMQYAELDGRAGTDRHFFDPDPSHRRNMWFVGVALSPDMSHGRVLAFMPMQLLHESDVYAHLELPKFRDTKRAVYWDDLRDRGLLPDGIRLPWSD